MKVVSTVLAAKAKGSVISDSEWIAYVRNVAEPIWDKYLKSTKWKSVGFDLCIESHPLTYRKLWFLVKVPCDGKSGFQNILLALGVICQHITLNTWKTVMPLTFFSAKTSIYQCHNLPFDFTLLNNVWPKSGVICNASSVITQKINEIQVFRYPTSEFETLEVLRAHRHRLLISFWIHQTFMDLKQIIKLYLFSSLFAFYTMSYSCFKQCLFVFHTMFYSCFIQLYDYHLLDVGLITW